MEKEKVNLKRANDYVKEALIFIGYPENISVSVYPIDE